MCIFMHCPFVVYKTYLSVRERDIAVFSYSTCMTVNYLLSNLLVTFFPSLITNPIAPGCADIATDKETTTQTEI